MNSYLSVLKRTLFSISEPSAPPTTSENAKALKENWIYIHSETNSTTDEVINLNETFDKITNGDQQNTLKINDEMAEEIRRNRELWLKKRLSSINGKYGSSTSNIKRTKLNINKNQNRKRNSNSASSTNSNSILNPELLKIAKLCDDDDDISITSSTSTNNQEKTESSEDKRKNYSTNHSPKLKMTKRSKLQGKHKPYTRVRTLNQPAAKGMC